MPDLAEPHESGRHRQHAFGLKTSTATMRARPRAPYVLLLCSFALAGPTRAATFNVNSTTDAVDAHPGDGVCATAGLTPVCTLRAAIQEANALRGADVINLQAQTYTLTIPGKNEDSAATGDLDINDTVNGGMLTINGAGTAATIIDGNQVDRVFDVFTDAAISNLTIRHGDPGLNQYGGGIYNSATLTLNNVAVTGNHAGVSGGGILNDGTVTLTNSTVSGNRADTAGGGISNTFELTLNAVTVSGNTANSGGGISNDFDMTLTNVTVSGNTAHTVGGGIAHNVTATLTAVTISDNTVEGDGPVGGDYYYLGDATFKYVIVAHSLAGDNCTGFGTLTSGGHNLDTGNTCGFTGTGDRINQVDAHLAPLGPYGGPTYTQALLAGSPAIDAGGTDCPPPGNDQRGVLRPLDGNGDGSKVCDIGAYESDGTFTTTTSSTTISTTTATTTTMRPPTITTTTTIRPTTTTTTSTATTSTTSTSRITTTSTTTTTPTTSTVTTTTSTSTTTTTNPGVCGDVNGDGVVNIGDALLVAQFDVGMRQCGQAPFGHPQVCDLNQDNACNIGDALRMAQCDVGLIGCAFTCKPFSCP